MGKKRQTKKRKKSINLLKEPKGGGGQINKKQRVQKVQVVKIEVEAIRKI